MKFLVFTPEPRQPPNESTTTLVQRAAGIVEGLRSHGLLVEASHAQTSPDRAARLQSSMPDVVLCAAGAATGFAAPLRQPLVVDLSLLSSPRPRGFDGNGEAARVRAALDGASRADFLIVSTARERLYALSLLLRVPVERPEARIVTIATPGTRDQDGHQGALEPSWRRAVEPLLDLLRAGVSGPRREVDLYFALPEDASRPVRAGRSMEQYFLCRVDGLCRVECCLSRHGQSRVAPVTLSLYRHGTGAADASVRLAAATLEESAVRDNDWVALDIEPVADSAGSTFSLRVESPAVDEDQSVWPWTFGGRLFPLLGLNYGGDSRVARSLCFRSASIRSLA